MRTNSTNSRSRSRTTGARRWARAIHPKCADYVEKPLPLLLTLTNLQGVPYPTRFSSTSGRPEYYSNHADYIRFFADVTGNTPLAPRRPDAVSISENRANGARPWRELMRAARGTSAYPVGLPPQMISRDIEHYRYRYAIRHDIDTTAGHRPPVRRRRSG